MSLHHDINSVQREIPRIPEGLRARAIVRELILYNRLDQDPRSILSRRLNRDWFLPRLLISPPNNQ